MTAELAVGLPAVVLALGLVLGTSVVGLDAVRVQLAAGAAARAAARGEDDVGVVAVARSVSGEASRVVLGRTATGAGDAVVRVEVHRSLHLALPVVGSLSTLDVAAASSALLEDGPTSDGPPS